ncbi:MAG: ATP-dependent Clp protease ATP-binding subunit [Patescibacteria group bacterium]
MIFKKNNLLICPDCHGKKTSERVCPTCQDLGAVYFLEDKILFYGKQLSRSALAFDKITQKIRVIFNLVLGLVGLSGFFYLAYVGIQNNFADFFSMKYWFTPTLEKLYFWFSLLIALYLYYRLDVEASSSGTVHKRNIHTVADFLSNDWSAIVKKNKNLLDISTAFNFEADKSVEKVWQLASELNHPDIDRVHYLANFVQSEKLAIILARLGVNFEVWLEKMARYLNKHYLSRPGGSELSAEMKICFLGAYIDAYENKQKKVDILNIAKAFVNENIFDRNADKVEEILLEFNINYQKVKNVLTWLEVQESLRQNLTRWNSLAGRKPKNGMNRSMTAVATPMVNNFCDDLTDLSRQGSFFPCLGREKEFEKIFRIFTASRMGALLVGNDGVGRTAIVQGLAEKMVAEDVPEVLYDKRLVSLDLSALTSGVNGGEAEQRLLEIFSEIIRSGNVILVIENIHNVIGLGGNGNLGLEQVLAELLNKHSVYVVATTTPKEFTSRVEGSALMQAFQKVNVEELEINDAICVLEVKSGPIEYENKVYFSYGAIENSAVLSNKYIQDRYLPEKAIEIMEQTAIKVKQEKGENKVISAEDVAEVVSAMTKIPLNQVNQKESQKLLNLENLIHERMIAQDEAVRLVAESLRRARAELREGKRPIASFLFLGPTGVGKTELAKSVAEVYFGREDLLLRFDMSEYQEQNSLNKLIGANGQAGFLTEAVRKNPFSLLLFDEVEKANPDILNLFLQVLDDGRLTDGMGRTIDFTNTIIIMTSNAGANYIQSEIGKGTAIEKIKTYLLEEELKNHFRPEFLNRFDGVIVFKPLTLVEVIKIAHINIAKITKRLAEKGIEFSATNEAIAELAELGFDPKFGARPLRRVIQEHVDNALADKLLKGEINRRDKVFLDVNGNLKVEKAQEI